MRVFITPASLSTPGQGLNHRLISYQSVLLHKLLFPLAEISRNRNCREFFVTTLLALLVQQLMGNFLAVLDQIWKLQQSQASSKINPSQIFALSLGASFDELTILNSQRQRVISKVNASSASVFPSLQECESLISDSLRLVNMSVTKIGIVPDGNIFKETKTVEDLMEWTSAAKESLERCRDELENDNEGLVSGKFYLVRMKMQMLVTRKYLENSLVILAKMDTILDMFYHPLQSILSNFMLSASGFDFGMVFFASQYLLLVFLFCLLVRLY
ncbi:putative pectinesterase/pectinesterase inhibitor 26 [Coffea arabica]|uniref:Pectinesterase/pectinesterase inhibitor 26 n=1 Tax=Coffea arabica TaxID=13443 RepID=A0A6P6XCN2_COFAR|nr:putative pectinesterase/pectinesterase inhibitor 26 [Coffea arabica]